MSLFKKLVVNAASIYAAKIFEGLLQLVILAFILKQVGKEYYAAALLIISFQVTIDLARGGMQKATLKYISEYNARSEYNGANSVLSTSTIMQGTIGIMGFIVCLIIAPYTTSIFAIPLQMQRESQWAIALLGIGIAVSFIISPWYNSVCAEERYDLLSIAMVGGKVLRALLILILLLFESPSLISIVLATIVGTVFERILCIYFIKRINPNLKFNFKNVSHRYFKIILQFSLFDFFHTLSSLLYSQGSFYLAAHLISLNAVANLGIISNICSLTGMVMHQFAQMLVPIASRLQVQEHYEKLKYLITHGTTITVFAGGIIMAALIPWVNSLFVVWLGQTYAELATVAVVLISAAYLVDSLTCIHNSLGGIGRVAADGLSNTSCTLLGLSVGVTLVVFKDLGLMGLAIGLFCARGFRFMFVNWYGTKIFNISLGKFMWNAYLRTYILIFFIYYLSAFFEVSITSWFGLFSASIITMFAFFLIAIFWIIDPLDRKRFKQLKFKFFQKSPKYI